MPTTVYIIVSSDNYYFNGLTASRPKEEKVIWDKERGYIFDKHEKAFESWVDIKSLGHIARIVALNILDL